MKIKMQIKKKNKGDLVDLTTIKNDKNDNMSENAIRKQIYVI